MKNTKAVVVIPFYKDNLSAYEQIALKQCLHVLSAHDIVAIKPEKLNLAAFTSTEPFSSVISFDDNYFEGVEGYNRLMLSAHFYKSFLDYEYLLIYQLDAFVFKDDLEYWCSQGFDYIGAPWIKAKNHSNPISAAISKIKNDLYFRYDAKDKHGVRKIRRQMEDRVGNGGFSLRRVSIFAAYCLKFKPLIDHFINEKETFWFNEDVFWSIELNRKKPQLKIPAARQALQFAFETYPARALKLNNKNLPFGCHAWEKNLDFWRPVFEKLGYVI